jgi:glycosyltransferase involved in cell wall biosynthesis
MEQVAPLISVGIPLYRSLRFLDIIVANIEAIEYENVEFIVSDRHLLDGTLALLQERYRDDRRFRFFSGTDQLNWVEHFNLILRHSTGKYSLWMGHDDSYPPNYIPDLVSALETHPDAVLAFGRVEQVSLDGFLPAFPFVPPPLDLQEEWSIATSVRLLTLWQLWIAFRGVVRRQVIEDSSLFIRQTYRNIRADIYWVFGLGLKGRLLYVPSCYCTKRFYRSSGGAGWRFGIRQSFNAFGVLSSYVNDLAGPSRESRKAKVVVCLWCMVQGFLPASLARTSGIMTRKILLGRRRTTSPPSG